MSGYPFFTLYIWWLVTQPAVGAMAAFWSRRAGGELAQRLLAALAPSLGMLVLFVIGPFLSMLIFLYQAYIFPGHGRAINFSSRLFLVAYFTLLVSWVLLPAAGLLIGAMPFLRKPQPQH
jgi:hypothetical protein